jgi:hypothetical protein
MLHLAHDRYWHISYIAYATVCPELGGADITAKKADSGFDQNRTRAAIVLPSLYIDLIRRATDDGVCSAGESTNVTHAFQPSGRLALSNSL